MWSFFKLSIFYCYFSQRIPEKHQFRVDDEHMASIEILCLQKRSGTAFKIQLMVCDPNDNEKPTLSLHCSEQLLMAFSPYFKYAKRYHVSASFFSLTLWTLTPSHVRLTYVPWPPYNWFLPLFRYIRTRAVEGECLTTSE